MAPTPSVEVIAFAEDPRVFVDPAAGEEQILTDRYCVTIEPGAHFWSASVGRVRFSPDTVGRDLAEIRDLVASRGRTAAAWRIGPSATPGDLHERLLAAGLEPESDEDSLILVLTGPPRVRPAPLQVRVVSSYDDHLAAIETGIEGFVFAEADARDERRRARETFETERANDSVLRWLVLDGGRPIATGKGWCSPRGMYLGGGATIPSERGRGAMSAMVAAAWEEAVRRGTPALATFGGPMSAPILKRLGFQALGRVRFLIDRLRS